MTTPFDPQLTFQVMAALSPLFTLLIRSPIAVERFGEVGFSRDDWWERYFAFRSAQMGAASLETVLATFYNFAPRHVEPYVPRIWEIAEPDVVITTLLESADEVMRTVIAQHVGTPELGELAELLGEACATAFAQPGGRALFAGIGGIPWPDEPHTQLWLAMYALREWRGDGHIIALASRGIDGLSSMLLHAGTGQLPVGALGAGRSWNDDEIAASVDALRGHGWLEPDEVVLTEAGTAFRAEIEAHTDDLAVPAYTTIGEEGVRRILALAPPIIATAAAAR
jgi:hypothetical protein